MTTTVIIRFRDRTHLAGLDVAAARLGGRRGTTEFRPCYAAVHPGELAHTALFLFPTASSATRFVATHVGHIVVPRVGRWSDVLPTM